MKKIISSILVCVMLLVFAVPCGFASEQTAYGDKVIFESENIKANSGEEFVLDVNVRDNPGLSGFNILLEYDAEYFDVSVQSENERAVIENSIIDGLWVFNEKYDEKTIYAMGVGVDNVFADGNLFGFKFSVKADAPKGKTSIKIILNEVVHVDDKGATYDVFDLFDGAKPTYDVEVLVNSEEELAEKTVVKEVKCLTEAEFATTYEERTEALQTPKPTPKPIDANLYPVKLEARSNIGAYMAPVSEKAFEPDRYATRYEMVAALNELFVVENARSRDEFSDVSQDYKKIVNDFAQVGVINGYEDKTFGGEKNMTRAEFVKLLTTAFDISFAGAENNSLNDISGHWAEEYISAFVNEGYILGYPDSSFRPDNNITRAEIVAVINRVLKIENAETTRTMFEDLTPEQWAYTAVMATFLR